MRVGLEVGVHIKCLASKYEQSLVSQLKCGVLPIRLETGRHQNERWEARICQCCSDDSVEDENHLLFDCPCFAVERREFLQKVQLNNSDVSLLTVMRHPYVLGKYLIRIWEKREHLSVICAVANVNKTMVVKQPIVI